MKRLRLSRILFNLFSLFLLAIALYLNFMKRETAESFEAPAGSGPVASAKAIPKTKTATSQPTAASH